jgi:hypothetical protein
MFMMGFLLLMSLTIEYLKEAGIYKASIYKGSKKTIYAQLCIDWKNNVALF